MKTIIPVLIAILLCVTLILSGIFSGLIPGKQELVDPIPGKTIISGSDKELPLPDDNHTVQPPLERAIAVDPLPDHFTDEPFTITGTTNLTPGDELLVEISSSGSARSIKGIISSGSAGTVTIREGAGGKNTWSYPVDPADFSPDEYLVVVSSYRSDAQDDALFMIYRKHPRSNVTFTRMTSTGRTHDNTGLDRVTLFYFGDYPVILAGNRTLDFEDTALLLENVSSDAEKDLRMSWYPNRSFMGFGTGRDEMVVIIHRDQPVNTTFIKEIYSIVEHHGRHYGIKNIPCRFVFLGPVKTESSQNRPPGRAQSSALSAEPEAGMIHVSLSRQDEHGMINLPGLTGFHQDPGRISGDVLTGKNPGLSLLPADRDYLKSRDIVAGYGVAGRDHQALAAVLHASHADLAPWLYPDGPVCGYGVSYLGVIEVYLFRGMQVNRSTPEEIYRIIETHGRALHYENIPVIFCRTTLAVGDAGSISRDNPAPGHKTGSSTRDGVPGKKNGTSGIIPGPGFAVVPVTSSGAG